MEYKNKSKRSSTFTEEEIVILINLVKKYKHIIECKKSNSLLWKKKIAIWNTIEVEFNNKSVTTHRVADCLRKKYDNLKSNCKQKYSTGGSPPTTINANHIHKELLDLLSTQVTDLPSAFYSDTDEAEEPLDEVTVIEDNDSNNCNNTNIQVEESVVDNNVDVDKNTNTWENYYSPELLKTAKSTPLQVKNDELVSNRRFSNKTIYEQWYKLATTKTSISIAMQKQAEEKWQIEKQFLLEEQKLKKRKLCVELEEAKIKKEIAEMELALLKRKLKDGEKI